MGLLLKHREGVKEVVRTMCLLHDIGKPPADMHTLRTRQIIGDILHQLGLAEYADDIAEAASRHHYGKYYRELRPEKLPFSKIQWLVAYADKIATQDRVILFQKSGLLSKALNWLAKSLDSESAIVNKIRKIADVMRLKSLLPSEDVTNISDMLPLDKEKRQTLDREILTAHTRLGLSETPLSVLLIEAEGIQRIVRRSEALKALIGSSAIVELAIRNVAREISRELAPESIVFVGGGALMAIIPKSAADQLVSRAIETYTETVEGAGRLKVPANLDYVSFSLFDLKNGPEHAWDAELSQPGELIFRSFAHVYEVALKSLEAFDHERTLENEEILKLGELCPTCQEDKVLPSDDPRVVKVRNKIHSEEREESYCSKCVAIYDLQNQIRDELTSFKINVSDNGEVSTELPSIQIQEIAELPPVKIARKAIESLKTRLADEFNKKEKMRTQLTGKTIQFDFVKTIDNLGRQIAKELDLPDWEEQKEVAVIKGDGDNFGLIKSSMVNITQYRRISETFREIIETGLAEALTGVMLNQINLHLENRDVEPLIFEFPFVVVYAGGDDFLLLIDASATFIFLNQMRNFLQERFGTLTLDDYEKELETSLSVQFIGMSLGIVIMKNRMPIYTALESAERLLSEAKEKSKRIQRQKEMFGTDITVALCRFTGIPTVAEIESRYQERDVVGTKVALTTWPRTGEEIFGNSSRGGLLSLTTFLIKNKIKANDIKRLIEISEPEPPKHAKLIINYIASRRKESSPKRKAFQMLAQNAVIEEEGVLKYQYRDIGEVMSIVFDNDQLLPR